MFVCSTLDKIIRMFMKSAGFETSSFAKGFEENRIITLESICLYRLPYCGSHGGGDIL